MHAGEVCVSPYLPFGGEDCSMIKVSGLTVRRKDRLWLPVSAYLIESQKGLLLVDCGWNRDMSPRGIYDRKAQVNSLGSRLLYKVNQGKVRLGDAVDEQLFAMGIRPSQLDYVLLTHLDCDHASGLGLVASAKNILVSKDEVKCANKHKARYKHKWWDGVSLTQFEWNGSEGPAGKSYDVFGDGSVLCINIPGHSDGLFAVKVTNREGRYVLLFSDGGYASRSWEQMIPSGIALDRKEQMASLRWIREQSMHCINMF